MTELSVLTLNLSRPTERRAPALLQYLWHRPEDVLALTEVAPGAGSNLVASVCRKAGYTTIDSRAGAYGVLMVCRNGVLSTDPDFPRPTLMPERVASAHWAADSGGSIRLVGIYGAASDPVRYSSSAQRQRKRDWLADFDIALDSADLSVPTLLIGDLNLVAPGFTDPLKYVLAEETAFYYGLHERHGLTDAFAALHPDDPELTWVDHSGVGCRYDHAFVTRDLAGSVVDCSIDHEPRTSGLTDHSALSITLEI